MTLMQAIERTSPRIGYRVLARRVGISPTALWRIIHCGEYPIRIGEAEVKQRIARQLEKAGIAADLDWPAPGVRPEYHGRQRRLRNGLDESFHATAETEGIQLMQLDRSVLQSFGLRVNPFLNDVESDDDVFPSKGHAQVATAIKDAIEQRGFLAVVAPSGAGKTTIWDGIEAEYGMRPDCVICKSKVDSREKMTPEHLARCLIYGLLVDNVRIHREAESRGRQLSSALRAIRTGNVDKRAVLYIDDAHFCNTSCLRQLKKFYEEKVGCFRLLSIILVGLPKELEAKLAAFPEIGNRIRLVEVPGVPVQEYLAFKLSRVGSSVEKVFEPAGLQAFLDRFRPAPRRPPVGYPPSINAACIRAMVKLHQSGSQPGERISREIIDNLPGGPAGRAA